MKNSKVTKVIAAVCLCLMLGVSLLAGCTLVTKDMAKYYNTVVASFSYEDGTTVDITKKELITAFGSYGYQYIQNYKMEKPEAYKQTIERIIDSKLTVKSAEKDAKAQNGGEVLTTKEKTYLWNKTYDAIQNNIVSYYKDINGIKGDSSSKDSSEGISREVYTPKAELVGENGNYSIKIKQTKTDEIALYLNSRENIDRDFNVENDKEVLYTYVSNFVRENAKYTQAYNKYVAQAKKAEDGMKLSTDNKSVMQREFKRIYEILYDSLMTSKYTESHQSQNSVTTINHILETYQNKVASDYNKYITEKASGYDDAVLKDVSKLNYFKTAGTEYFYVSHILAKFSKEQQNEYDECTKCIKGESDKYTVGVAKAKIEQLYANLTFPVRQYNETTGKWKETGETKSLEAVLQEVKLKLATAGDDEYLKAEYFDEFVYKYNEDTGIQNSARNYVIGVDYTTPDTKKGTPYTAHSNMVEPFTNAAISVYNNGNAKIGDIYSSEDDMGLVRSNYGVHIIVYEGKVQNLFTGIDKNFKLSTKDIEMLDSKQARLKAGESKTIFDAIFDEINTDRYSVYENMNLEKLRSEVSIKYYPDGYKDLVK